MAGINLKGGTSATIGTAGTSQISKVTVTGAPTGGDFTITVGADTTAGIAFNAAAATVETAVTGLTAVGASNATVARAGAGSAGDPYIYTITFKAAKAATALTVSADGAGLTGGTTPAATATTPTPGVARAAGTAEVNGARCISVQVNPSADAAGNVSISGTVDGTNYVLLEAAFALTASTPVIKYYTDKGLRKVKVDTTALTAGTAPAYIGIVKE